ncbi:hypothetical protein D3C86_1841270 [compost metagenome]
MHNGTFDLAMHGWTEPFERVLALAGDRGIALATPRMGERLELGSPQETTRWWRGTDEVSALAPNAP